MFVAAPTAVAGLLAEGATLPDTESQHRNGYDFRALGEEGGCWEADNLCRIAAVVHALCAAASEFGMPMGAAPVGAHNSVVGADQGFRAPSGDQESVGDWGHEDSASAPIAAGQRPRPSFRHPQGFRAPTREYPISVWSVALSADRRLPADLVPAGAWPDELPADAGPDVQLAAGIAIRLKKRVDGLTLRKAQQRTGISRSTINKIINGRTWPTIHTIANLEAGLKMRLWGKEHRRWK